MKSPGESLPFRFGFFVGFFLLSVEVVHGCSCVRRPESTVWDMVAVAAQQTDVVFEAKVVAVANGLEVTGEDEDDFWIRRYFTVETLRQYRGHVPLKTVVATGVGMGDCGFDFRIGEIYLVYADKEEDGELTTSICHRTRHVDHADVDLRFLRGEQPNKDDRTQKPDRAAQGADAGGMLCGIVRQNDDPVVGGQVMIWRVQESGREIEWEESSGEDGSYCARGLGPGRYVISAVEGMPESEQSDEEIPASFRYAPPAGAFGGLQKPTEIELAEGQEVRGLDIFLEGLSGFRVAGRIGIEGGMPQAELIVSLGTGSSELFVHLQTLRLRPGSEFVFEAVPSGSYRLEVLFFDKAWKDWVTPTQEMRITGNSGGLFVLPERRGK